MGGIVDAQGRKLDRNGNPIYPRLPLATYFANAGLSDRDAIETERRVLARVRQKIREKVVRDDRGTRFRYLNDHSYRAEVNQGLIREALAEFGFSQAELAEMDRGLKLGLVERTKRMVARVLGIDGRERSFAVTELEDRRPGGAKLTSLEDVATGEKIIA